MSYVMKKRKSININALFFNCQTKILNRSRMTCQITPVKLVSDPGADKKSNVHHDAIRLAAISTVAFKGDPVPGGMIKSLWAFMSSKGKRAMFVLGEQESDKSKTLHVRGDDKMLLLCLVGTRSSRHALISALQPGFTSASQDIFS